MSNPVITQNNGSKTVQFNLSSFAVPADRQRSQSRVWLAGMVIIFLPWVFFLLKMLFTGSDSSSSGLLGELEKWGDDAADALANFGLGLFVILHTAAMLIFLECIWSVRKILGRSLDQH